MNEVRKAYMAKRVGACAWRPHPPPPLKPPAVGGHAGARCDPAPVPSWLFAGQVVTWLGGRGAVLSVDLAMGEVVAQPWDDDATVSIDVLDAAYGWRPETFACVVCLKKGKAEDDAICAFVSPGVLGHVDIFGATTPTVRRRHAPQRGPG